MLRRRFGLLVAAIGALVVGTLTDGVAQDATPVAPPPVPPAASPPASPVAAAEGRLDLAAMALTDADLPTDLELSFEGYFSGDRVAQDVTGGILTDEEVAATGLLWFYDSSYASLDGTLRVRSYLEEYSSPEGAIAGFNLLEDETRFAALGIASTDRPAPGLGEGPSEITLATTPATETAAETATIDVTFRIGRVVAGVSIDTSGPTAPDEQEVLGLARVLEERVRAVLDGASPAGVDLSLGAAILPLDEQGLSLQEGYVSLADSLGPAAEADIFSGYRAGYAQTVALGVERNPDLPLPFVTVALSSFDSEEGPLAVLTTADELQPPFAALEAVRIEPIAGASAAVGYRFANALTGGEQADSFRLLVVVGSWLITVDVQGAGAADAAQEAALDLAAQQIACLAKGGECATVSLPDALFAVPPATPEAQPVG